MHTPSVFERNRVRAAAILAIIVVSTMPLMGEAQETFKTFIGKIISIVQLTFPIIFSFSLLATIYGGAVLILNAGDERAIGRGKRMLFWGVAVLFISLAYWSIVLLLRRSFFGT